ncbi:MFS transporter [Trinickia sp. NRRL B-1857]|uniref:MFS transporter n=1 Tax=Trinickia sp. NRRL B-1857 TaxID=3162879 RepID=UPI003D2D88F0
MDASPVDSRSENNPSNTSTRGWLSVAAVSFGTFALVTSELMPIGLLPKIAAGVNAAEGNVGLTITIPGLVAAFAAPALLVAAGRLDRRWLLWLTSALLIASNLIVASAATLSTLLAGRVLLGISIGGFWAIGAAVARRLVPPESVGRATALVFSGVSAGTVIGLPAGTLLGELCGWRFAFTGAATLGGIALAAQLYLLPKLAATDTVGLWQLPAVARTAKARVALLAVALAIGGQFMAYTYLASFLERYASISPSMVSAVLLAYGVAGLVGNTIAGELVQGDVRRVLTGAGLLVAATILCLPLIGSHPFIAVALVVIWGGGFGAVPVSLQTAMFMAAPTLQEGSSALFVSTFQLALASGAFLGGLAVNSGSITVAMVLGGAAVLTMAGTVWIFFRSAPPR